MTAPADCPHRDLIAHAGWWACRDCGQAIDRHPSVADYIAAMRTRLRCRDGAIDVKEITNPDG